MKKKYKVPEYEVVEIAVNEMISTSNECTEDQPCNTDCTTCYYLVCNPEDVIIGG